MAVSVPQHPTASSLRVYFLLYVCFCLAISTVFQAFFVSFLVEPNYEKQIETLDDLLHSDVVFGDHPLMYYGIGTVSFPELATFLEHKTLKEDCSEYRKCVERMRTKRDIALVYTQFLATYEARELGTVDVDKIICCLNGDVISGGVTVLFRKGNPFLDRFNILMRRYLEAGLHEMLWTELQHRASLKGGDRLRDADGEKFFPFSISHLKPAFVVLLVGTVLSFVVFISELTVNCLCERGERKETGVRGVRVLC
jgi:hypothetical protein